MSQVNYPDTFPAESIAHVVAVIRKQEEIGKGKLGHALWNVQGYLQKLVLGDPDTEAIIGQLHIEAETLAVALESLNPEGPQAILGGGLTKKLLFMLITRLLEKVIGGADLPASLEGLINDLLGKLLGGE